MSKSIKYLTHFTYFCSFHITSRLRGAKRIVIWVSIYVNRKKEKEKKELTHGEPLRLLIVKGLVNTWTNYDILGGIIIILYRASELTSRRNALYIIYHNP